MGKAERLHLRLIAALLLLTGALLSGLALAVRQPAGTLIGTATHVDYTIDGVRGFLTTESNIPWIEIQPLPSHSALTLMRAAEHGGTEDAIITDVAFALAPDSSDPDSFVPQDETPLGGKHVIRVIRSGGFMPGETVFIRLRDPGLNHLPDVAETVLVRLASENGDVEMFRMAAAGPDSPDFYGYAVVAAADDVVRGDGRISGAPNTVIEARYVDPFETEDESVSYAVVDPSLRVFDATTGVPLDGARLRVIDMGAGHVAQVFGIGGEAAMVGEIVSGQDLSDADGHVYSAETGEAIMPHLRAGRYRIEVEPPPGYVFPSDAGDATIASFGQNYRLGTGARGGEFEIEGGGPPQFDLPLDPRGSFFLRRSVSRSEVAIGDTIGFTITLTNDDARDATGIAIAERLPRGFRLVEGSVRIDGTDTGDPERSADGESFSFDIESLKSGQSVRIAYAVRVSAGAGFGFFEALASARAPNGFRSNAARIGLTVRDALGTADGHVMGAVLAGPCDARGRGVRARLVTETGSLIDTDGDGRFHISGLRPGLHALRLDETSLPDWLVPMACPGDLRPGDTPTARTIETRGGMLRGVAFRVRDTRAPAAGAGTSQAAGQADPSAEAVTSPRATTASAPPANTPLDLTATAKPVKVWKPEDLAAFDGLTLAYPQAGARPEGPLLDLGIAYPFGHRLEVRINGQPVPEDRYEGVIGNRTARIAMRQWRGIETGPGPVEISAIMRDKAGNETGRLSRRLGDAGASSDTAEAGVPVPLTVRHIQPSPVAENRADRRSELSPAPTTAPARHIHDADDLAALPQAAQILYPGDGRGIEGGQFELGILHPFGTRVEAFVDGKEIDRKHVEKSIVNRRAKLVLRRWSGIPATADEVEVTAIIHHRDGAEERLTRQLKTAPAAVQPLDTAPDIPAPDAPAVTLPTQAAETPDDPPLAALPRRLQIVYPAEGASLPDPSLRLGIAHPLGTRLDVTVAGVPLDGRSAEKSVTDKASGMVMRRWRGVDLADGETLVVARLLSPDGTVLEEVRRSVHYVTEAADAVLLPQKSILVADGRTAPVIAVRVTDDAGRPLHAGRRIEAVLAPPYQSAVSFERFENDPLSASGSTRTALVVGEDGIARLTLRPTTQTGEVDLRVRIGTREKRLRPWMAASARPWIVVGIAEGTIGHAGISGNMEAAERAGARDEIYTDGRIAFYAKGAIRGEWLLTVAYDSDADFDRDAVRERIDPDAYYPVYGDASVRQEDAQSRYPLYVRLERGTFYALFGDYDTGLNRTELGAYTRTMSGFKTVYEGANTSVVAFAAEADRQYRRVELQANLGVGPYALGGPATLNSETVRIVTRNRDRLDETLSETVLAPFLDYDIDHSGGLVTLRLPPEPVDSDFNPRFVVVEFERDATDPGRFTVGGRVARRFLDDRAELGATAIHEEGSGIDARGDLVALDGRIDVTDALTLEGEVAASRVSEDGVTREGQAYRAEARYMAEGWRARIYMHEADPDFGVTAQSVGRIGRRVIGAELTAEVADPFAPDIDGEGTPRMLDIEAEAYRDEALDSNARRDAVELTVSREVDLGSLGRGETTVGYRGENDRTVSGDTASAHRLIGRMTADVLGGWAAVTVEREQTLFSNGDAAPDATRASVTARLTDRIDGRVGVEASDEGDVNAIAGISARAWEGGRVEAGLMGTQPGGGGGAQVNATLGVQQEFALTDTVSLTLRGARTQALAGSDSLVASTLFRSAAAEDTTTLSAGVGYRGDAWRTSVRLDTLHRSSGDSYNLGGAVLRDSDSGLTLAAAFDARHAETLGDPAQTASLTLASAWRSDDGRSAALQRLDLLFDDSADDSRKVIHAITATREIGERLTLGGAHALRLARIRTLGETYETVTQFVAADIFYRLAEKWRLGFHGDALFDLKSGEVAYAYGGSVGYSPRAGMNLALGYTVEGFEDEDFAAANFTRQGAWLRLGLRFSETDLGTIMPRAVADALEQPVARRPRFTGEACAEADYGVSIPPPELSLGQSI